MSFFARTFLNFLAHYAEIALSENSLQVRVIRIVVAAAAVVLLVMVFAVGTKIGGG